MSGFTLPPLGTRCVTGCVGPQSRFGCRANTQTGCAIAQAVSRRLPTTEARVRSQVKSCGIYSGQNDTGASFLQILLFPLPIFILPNAPCSFIIRGWYDRPISGRCTKWPQSHPRPRNSMEIPAPARNRTTTVQHIEIKA
jgi:hypothetical protein